MNCDISEVDLVGGDIGLVIAMMCEPSKPFPVEVDRQRAIAHTQNIEPEVEFFVTD